MAPLARIRVLDTGTAARIAAGEVIERPASVVKELVENSLDAGATRIAVELVDGGRRLIRVTDNGCGIPRESVPLLFRRHATSKIASLDDLDRLASYGFRGEALASIAAVADVVLMTRAAGDGTGTRVEVTGGAAGAPCEAAAPPGTVVEVRDLFSGIPARRKHQKSASVEAGRAAAVVTRCAIARPEVAFSLHQNGTETFHSPGNGQLADLMAILYGPQRARGFVRFGSEPRTEQGAVVKVSGLAAPPDFSRAGTEEVSLFVNGRWVASRALLQAVRDGYGTLLPKGRQPVAVVFVEVPPGTVDANVHPAKTEVRLADEDSVVEHLAATLRQALAGADLIPSEERQTSTGTTGTGAVREAAAQYSPVVKSRMNAGQETLSVEEALPVSGRAPTPVPAMKLIGQVHDTYIIAETEEGMLVLDQHAAHERILFERASREKGRWARQELIEAVHIHLTPSEKSAVEAMLPMLEEAGFALEPAGRSDWAVRTVPSLVGRLMSRDEVHDVFADLLMEGRIREPEFKDKLLATIACRAAIKAGDPKANEALKRVVEELYRCEQPFTCPHGRPTIILVTLRELERRFKRG